MKKMLPVKPLSANPTEWSNTLKQFFGNLPTRCLTVFDCFVGLAFKGLTFYEYISTIQDTQIKSTRG